MRKKWLSDPLSEEFKATDGDFNGYQSDETIPQND